MVTVWQLATEGELVDLAIRVCADMGKPVPIFHFREVGHSWCKHREKTIQLPTRHWIETFLPFDHPVLYRELMLHELAHWILGEGHGHSPNFYELLFTLCEGYGVPVDLALKDEAGYKPRNAPRGFRLYQSGLVSA